MYYDDWIRVYFSQKNQASAQWMKLLVAIIKAIVDCKLNLQHCQTFLKEDNMFMFLLHPTQQTHFKHLKSIIFGFSWWFQHVRVFHSLSVCLTLWVKQGRLKHKIAVFLNALVILDSSLFKDLLPYHYTSETENGQKCFWLQALTQEQFWDIHLFFLS